MIGFIFMVLALFKCGLPEIPMYAAQAADAWGSPNGRSFAVAPVLNALGLVFHHAGALYVVAGISLGYWVPSRPLVSVVIPLICQHMCNRLQYVSFAAYVVVNLSLEAWWELEVFSTIEYLGTSLHCPLLTTMDALAIPATGLMLLSHWLYLVAGAVELAVGVAPVVAGSKHLRLRRMSNAMSSGSELSSTCGLEDNTAHSPPTVTEYPTFSAVFH